MIASCTLSVFTLRSCCCCCYQGYNALHTVLHGGSVSARKLLSIRGWMVDGGSGLTGRGDPSYFPRVCEITAEDSSDNDVETHVRGCERKVSPTLCHGRRIFKKKTRSMVFKSHGDAAVSWHLNWPPPRLPETSGHVTLLWSTIGFGWIHPTNHERGRLQWQKGKSVVFRL